MIKTENLSFVYGAGMPSEYTAIKNINLEIKKGSLTAIIGHTGSGKSTLIQHFNALIKPTSGKIFIDGVDITDPKCELKTIRKMVGLVFQYPEYQLFEDTVYKDIAFGPKNIGISEEETDKRIKRACDIVGLKEKYINKSPFELSGGLKRRVAIAGVIAMEPKVLILDEPAAGLDPKGRNSILQMLKNIHETNKDMTIIFVSHSMEDVARIAEEVVVMNDGEIYAKGSVGEIFSMGDELEKIGLSVPQITILVNKLRDAGYDIPADIYTVGYGAGEILKLINGGN